MIETFAVMGKGDPAIYFAWVTTVILCQLMIWGIGRTTFDTEWWRGGIIGSFSILAMIFIRYSIVMEGNAGLVLAYVIAGIILWVLSGFVYEMDWWQKLVVAVFCPLFAALGLYLGVGLRNCLGMSF